MIPNDDRLVGIQQMSEYLNISIWKFYQLRHQYAETIPCPVFKALSRSMTKKWNRWNCWSTRWLLLSWYWKVLEAEREKYRGLGRRVPYIDGK